MSISVTLQIPLHTAAAIQNGDYDSKQLSGYVVDAVQALPQRLSLSATVHSEHYRVASASTVSVDATEQLTPASSILSRDDVDLQTLMDERGTVRAPSPTPSMASISTMLPRYQAVDSSAAARSFAPPQAAVSYESRPPIEFPTIDFKEKSLAVSIDCGPKGTFPLPVKNTMIVGDVMVEIEHRTSIPIAQQRLKLTNGKMLDFTSTLEACGIKPGWKIVTTRLIGICFPDSDLDFWVHIGPGSSVPQSRFPVHCRPTTTTRDLSLALFAEHRVPVRQQRLFLGSDLVLFNGSDEKSGTATMETLGIYGTASILLRMVIADADGSRPDWQDPPPLPSW